MGRSILADDRIQKQIENLYSLDTWTVGVIIGQVQYHTEYVIRDVIMIIMDDQY